MHRRLGERDLMAAAHRFDAPDLVQDLGRRRGVVVARLGHRAGRQDARVEHAAEHDADAFFLRQREKFLERRLLEQRIASGAQHDVEVAGAGIAGQPAGVVEPDADAADHFLGAQLVERDVGAGHRLLEARLAGVAVGPAVGVVNQQQIEAVEPEPDQRLLDRAPHAVIGVVVDAAMRESADEARLAHARLPRLHAPPDLGRQHEFFARNPAERSADAMLGQAVAVMRRGVEQRHARLEGGAHRADRRRVVEHAVDVAQRRAAESQRRHLDAGAAERPAWQRGSHGVLPRLVSRVNPPVRAR